MKVWENELLNIKDGGGGGGGGSDGGGVGEKTKQWDWKLKTPNFLLLFEVIWKCNDLIYFWILLMFS